LLRTLKTPLVKYQDILNALSDFSGPKSAIEREFESIQKESTYQKVGRYEILRHNRFCFAKMPDWPAAIARRIRSGGRNGQIPVNLANGGARILRGLAQLSTRDRLCSRKGHCQIRVLVKPTRCIGLIVTDAQNFESSVHSVRPRQARAIYMRLRRLPSFCINFTRSEPDPLNGVSLVGIGSVIITTRQCCFQKA
jgi:hypothetical protein